MKNLKTLFFIALATALTACGSSKSGDGYGEATLSSTSATSSSDALAVCSKDGTNLSDFQVAVEQYVDLYGQTRNDMVRLRFIKAPLDWKTNNLDLTIYRWSASPSGAVTTDSSPLYFQFERKVSGGFQTLSNTAYRYFNWTEIVQMGTYANISTTTPQSFFDTASIVIDIKDPNGAYQALQVVLFQGSSAARRVDVLIPTFQADPAKYNADPRHPAVLQQLHPLKNLLGQNWSQSQYDQFAKAFCF